MPGDLKPVITKTATIFTRQQSKPLTAHTATQTRIDAIDALRGIALILMGLDHAAYFARTGIQAEHYINETTVLESWPHWVTGLFTNIASPTFWFLSGISLALFVLGRRKKGASEQSISQFLITRAGLIILLDFTIVGMMWGYSFNVLSSLGAGVRRRPVHTHPAPPEHPHVACNWGRTAWYLVRDPPGWRLRQPGTIPSRQRMVPFSDYE